MNFKNQAIELEKSLEENFKTSAPIVVLSNGNLIYKNFIIKRNKTDKWNLIRLKGSKLDTFNLKTCALLGAKFYGSGNFSKYNELKILDSFYFKHQVDSEIFKKRYDQTKDSVLKDIFMARLCESQQQAQYAKEEITSKFKALF